MDLSSQLRELRALALELLAAGLAAVEGRAGVRQALSGSASLPGCLGDGLGGPVRVLAVGKAAAAMTLGAYDALGPALTQALVITKDGHGGGELPQLPGVTVMESAHPVPDERSLAAGEAVLEWVSALPADCTPLFLVSGGASSLVEVLEPGVTLSDLTRMTAAGLAAGIDITELNARRRQRSRLKGGRLTALLGGRRAQALFISDVPGDDPAVIGSGLLGPAPQGADAVQRRIVGSIDRAVAAAALKARQLGWAAEVAQERFAGEASELAARFCEALQGRGRGICVWGGESTVTLPEHPGLGGRSQHLALTAAPLIAGAEQVLLAAGTDGTDGPTAAAGALVDGGTMARLAQAGIDVAQCLAQADSGRALAACGDLITTGPTGTNVGDLVIGLSLPHRPVL